jgi:hypothetical protein
VSGDGSDDWPRTAACPTKSTQTNQSETDVVIDTAYDHSIMALKLARRWGAYLSPEGVGGVSLDHLLHVIEQQLTRTLLVLHHTRNNRMVQLDHPPH